MTRFHFISNRTAKVNKIKKKPNAEEDAWKGPYSFLVELQIKPLQKCVENSQRAKNQSTI